VNEAHYHFFIPNIVVTLFLASEGKKDAWNFAFGYVYTSVNSQVRIKFNEFSDTFASYLNQIN